MSTNILNVFIILMSILVAICGVWPGLWAWFCKFFYYSSSAILLRHTPSSGKRVCYKIVVPKNCQFGKPKVGYHRHDGSYLVLTHRKFIWCKCLEWFRQCPLYVWLGHPQTSSLLSVLLACKVAKICRPGFIRSRLSIFILYDAAAKQVKEFCWSLGSSAFVQAIGMVPFINSFWTFWSFRSVFFVCGFKLS